MPRLYDEMIDFIAGGTTPQTVVDFEPSPSVRDRVGDLLAREKTSGLDPDESAELNHFLELEHLMRLAKARARQRIAS